MPLPKNLDESNIPPHGADILIGGKKRSTAAFQAAADRNKSEFEKNLELKQKFAEIEAKDRERKKIEHAIRTRSRPLTPWEKFKGIKPTGSRGDLG